MRLLTTWLTAHSTKRARNDFAMAMLLRTSRGYSCCWPAIAAELRHRFHELALLRTRVLDIAINLQVFDNVQGAEHVAAPHKSFQAPSSFATSVARSGLSPERGASPSVCQGDPHRDVEPVQTVHRQFP